MNVRKFLNAEFGYGWDCLMFHRGSDNKVAKLKDAAIAAQKSGFGFIVCYTGSFCKTRSTILGWNVEVMSLSQAKKKFVDNPEIINELGIISLTHWPRKEPVVAVTPTPDGLYVFPMEGFDYCKVNFDDLMNID